MSNRKFFDSFNDFDSFFKEIILSSNELSLDLDLEKIPPHELKNSFKRLISLYKLGSQIFAETQEQKVFNTIISSIASLLKIERAFIAVIKNDGLVPYATYNISLNHDVNNWPVSSTMMRRVLKERISLLTTDAIHDDQYKKSKSVDLHNIRSVLCSPLGGPIKIKGLIYVDNRICAGAFSLNDLKFLNALSYYALLAIENAEQRRILSDEKELAQARLTDLCDRIEPDKEIIGKSRQIVSLYNLAKKIALKDIPVLLLGETGTGKELLAKFIHNNSPRANGPFIPVNIAALPSTLVESELFGHEKGAFTGAEKKRIGRFELAQGGILFLDEVLDIPLNIQAKLLRILEERRFERLGSNESIQTDVRLICASNKDPLNMINKEFFREDLFYRLNSVILELPALRNCREDIPLLINHFLKLCSSEKHFDNRALECITNYTWPGNIRELKNFIEAIDAMVDENIIYERDLPSRMQKTKQYTTQMTNFNSFERLPLLIKKIEKEHIKRAINITKGNNEEAIKLLGISRSKFFQKKKEYEF